MSISHKSELFQQLERDHGNVTKAQLLAEVEEQLSAQRINSGRASIVRMIIDTAETARLSETPENPALNQDLVCAIRLQMNRA
jgi:hypothetical protein